MRILRCIFSAVIVAVLAAGVVATNAAAEWKPRRPKPETTGSLAPVAPEPQNTPSMQPTPAPPRAYATLRPASLVDAGRLELAETSGADTARPRQSRLPVSDLIVRIHAANGGALAAVLAAPNAAQSARGPTALNVELFLVTQGRLLLETRAQCGAFVDDIAICRTPCKDGAFAVVRAETSQGPVLRFSVGQAPSREEDGQIIDGVRLGNQCGDEAFHTRLVPRRGLKLADFELRAE